MRGRQLEEFLERYSYVDIKTRSLMLSGIVKLLVILPSVQTDWCWELGSSLWTYSFVLKSSILNSLESTVGY